MYIRSWSAGAGAVRAGWFCSDFSVTVCPAAIYLSHFEPVISWHMMLLATALLLYFFSFFFLCMCVYVCVLFCSGSGRNENVGERKDGKGGEEEASGRGAREEATRSRGAAQEAQRSLNCECWLQMSTVVVVVVVVVKTLMAGLPASTISLQVI